MAYGIEHGILGLEGVHRVAGRFDMNTTNLPRAKLDRIIGIHSLPEADDNRETNYGRGGEQVYPSNARGKTITYEGRIQARSVGEMRSTTHSLRYACSLGRLYDTTFEVLPPAIIGGISHTFDARVLSFDADDEWTTDLTSVPTIYQRNFTIAIRQGDPRYYAVGIDTNASAGPGTVIAVNHLGNSSAEPNFVVSGPIPGTLIFHRFDNFIERKLVYGAVGLPGGEQLHLNFKLRTLVSNAGNSYEHKRIFDDSNWWDASAAGLNPGVTNVTVEGGGNWAIGFAQASW